MIHVTRLNGRPFVVNAELIKLVEETPDTMITLVGGDRVVVAESMEEVILRAIEYGRTVRAFSSGLPQPPCSAAPVADAQT
jgi:flagellar protein FlbD